MKQSEVYFWSLLHAFDSCKGENSYDYLTRLWQNYKTWIRHNNKSVSTVIKKFRLNFYITSSDLTLLTTDRRPVVLSSLLTKKSHLLAVFYVGMYRWYGRGRAARKFNISYAIAQTAGLFEALLLIMTTAYPLGVNTKLHSIFSTAHMIAMDCFLCFTATGFLMNRNIHKGLGFLGFATAVFNMITTNAFSDFYLAEWIFFLLFMVYMVLVVISYDKIREPVNEAANSYQKWEK